MGLPILSVVKAEIFALICFHLSKTFIEHLLKHFYLEIFLSFSFFYYIVQKHDLCVFKNGFK